ncbi:MAG: MFS transporter [Planctomycetaceae bacterium]|nr:MFS transporter [Planctomycetaceae bacterium]
MSETKTNTESPRTLWNKGFIALIITQFTVAFNDNAFRWLLIPIGKCYADNDTIRLLGGVFLLVPFVLWTSIAGYVTDRFSRRRVIIWCKIIEFILLFAAILIIGMGPAVNESGVAGGVVAASSGIPLKVTLLLAILFLLGSQSAFFSPSKYGVIPDLVPENQLSAANGFVAMLTMIACISGQLVGGYVFFWTSSFREVTIEGLKQIQPTGIPGSEQIWITSFVLLGVALLGLISSLFIPRFKAVDSCAIFPRNPFLQTGRDLLSLFSYRKLFWIALASAFFWGLAALTQNNIDKYASEFLKVQQQYVTILIAVLSIGIGVGSVICGYLSRGRIELGLVPIGAFGMGLSICVLGFTPRYAELIGAGMGDPCGSPYIFATIVMLLTGLWAGLYDVPLAAYIQHNSPTDKRGRMIAAYNFMSFSTMIVFLVVGMLGGEIFNSINRAKFWDYDPSLLIWISAGLLTVGVGVVLIYHLWASFVIFVFRLWLINYYRPKVIGLENLPESGGYILASNHISLVDGMLIYSVFPKNIRFLAFEPMIPKCFEPLVRATGLIKLLPGKKAVVAIKAARDGLQNGDVIGIFPEGGITRNSQMRHFESGFLSILKSDPNSPVVPVYIHGLFGSMFSYKFGDKIKFSLPKFPSNVVIAFGKPIRKPENALQVQLAVKELSADVSRETYNRKLLIPARAFIKTCKKRKSKTIFAQTDGLSISGNKLLAISLLLKRILRASVLDERADKVVGILTPASIDAAVINAAVTLDKKIAVNINPDSDIQTIKNIIKNAEIKHIITSRNIASRYGGLIRQIGGEVICYEDLLDKVSVAGKILATINAIICPQFLIEIKNRLRGQNIHNDTATIIFNDNYAINQTNTTSQTNTINTPDSIDSNPTDTTRETHSPDQSPRNENHTTFIKSRTLLTNDNLALSCSGFVDAMRLNANDVIFGAISFSQAVGYIGSFWNTIFSGSSCLFDVSDQMTNSALSDSALSNSALSNSTLSDSTLSDSVLSNFVRIKNGQLPKVSFVVADSGLLLRCLSVGGEVGGMVGLDFSGADVVVCDVRCLTVDLLDAWESRFGVRPVGGFFVVEVALFCAVNVPISRAIDDFHIYNKEGSAGRSMAGVVIKVDDAGKLIIKSPQTINAGWLQTDQKGYICNDGFTWLNNNEDN